MHTCQNCICALWHSVAHGLERSPDCSGSALGHSHARLGPQRIPDRSSDAPSSSRPLSPVKSRAMGPSVERGTWVETQSSTCTIKYVVVRLPTEVHALHNHLPYTHATSLQYLVYFTETSPWVKMHSDQMWL